MALQLLLCRSMPAARGLLLPKGLLGSAGICCQTSGSNALRTFCSQAPRAGASKGPVSYKTLFITLFAGAGVVAAARTYEQQKMQQIATKSQQVIGKAAVGGPFSLIDQDGNPFTEQNLLGEFSLLYFGFTYCPDICPDELEKMAEALDAIEQRTKAKVLPVFISVDPERDTPAQVKQYVKEFHPRLIGLTGDIDTVKQMCKSFRVYYHKTDETKDYLVDHSIIMYLMNPEGDFVTFFGKNYTVEQLSASISEHIEKWRQEHAKKQ